MTTPLEWFQSLDPDTAYLVILAFAFLVFTGGVKVLFVVTAGVLLITVGSTVLINVMNFAVTFLSPLLT